MDLNFSLDDINNAASQLLKAAANKTVLAFHGQMGAGKTTFIHALCRVLGVKGTVSSPTFSIINQYITPAAETVYHMDLYRLKDEQEALNAGVEDCLYSGSLCMVEWPEKAPGIFPDDTLHITITSTGTNTRKVSFNL